MLSTSTKEKRKARQEPHSKKWIIWGKPCGKKVHNAKRMALRKRVVESPRFIHKLYFLIHSILKVDKFGENLFIVWKENSTRFPHVGNFRNA